MVTRRMRLAGVDLLFCDPRAPAPAGARRLGPVQLRRLLIAHENTPALRNFAREIATRSPGQTRHTRTLDPGHGMGFDALLALACYTLASAPPRVTPGPIPTGIEMPSILPLDPLPMFDEQQHWVEIQLLGDDDDGVSGVLCEITLSNGKVVQRSTDGHGLVRIEGVTNAASCSVRFPTLDAEAWEPA